MNKPKKTAKASSKTKVAKRTPLRARKTVPRMGTDKPGKPNDIGWHDLFINTLGQNVDVTMACKVAGVSRNTAYEHKAKFPEFGKRWDDTIETALDSLVSVAFDHARNGTERPVFQGGEEVGRITEFDHNLLQWLLERRRSGEYGAKSKLELSGKVTMTEEEEIAQGAEAIKSITGTIRHAAMQGKHP